MTTTETNTDYLNLPQKLPGMLNVLTILTFIGCAIFGLLTLFSAPLWRFSLDMMDKAASQGNVSAKDLADMEKGRPGMELMLANATPLILIGMVGIVLCFVGALMMRKLKKDGFWVYVAGQVIPLAGSFAIVGMAPYTSAWSYIGFIFPILFIALYASQRKYMVR